MDQTVLLFWFRTRYKTYFHLISLCLKALHNFSFNIMSPSLLLLEKQKFLVRGHLYQARSLIGSDDSGLSGLSK